MSDFICVAKVGDIPEGEGRSYPVNGTMVAIFLTGGEYKAISDFCPHMGSSLAGGYVDANSVTCPWHAWRFCIDDGLWLDNPKSQMRVPCYEVRVEGDDILVNVPLQESPEPPAAETPVAETPSGETPSGEPDDSANTSE